jgi:hypothetical protein
MILFLRVLQDEHGDAIVDRRDRIACRAGCRQCRVGHHLPRL